MRLLLVWTGTEGGRERLVASEGRACVPCVIAGLSPSSSSCRARPPAGAASPPAWRRREARRSTPARSSSGTPRGSSWRRRSPSTPQASGSDWTAALLHTLHTFPAYLSSVAPSPSCNRLTVALGRSAHPQHRMRRAPQPQRPHRQGGDRSDRMARMRPFLGEEDGGGDDSGMEDWDVAGTAPEERDAAGDVDGEELWDHEAVVMTVACSHSSVGVACYEPTTGEVRSASPRLAATAPLDAHRRALAARVQVTVFQGHDDAQGPHAHQASPSPRSPPCGRAPLAQCALTLALGLRRCSRARSCCTCSSCSCAPTWWSCRQRRTPTCCRRSSSRCRPRATAPRSQARAGCSRATAQQAGPWTSSSSARPSSSTTRRAMNARSEQQESHQGAALSMPQ